MYPRVRAEGYFVYIIHLLNRVIDYDINPYTHTATARCSHFCRESHRYENEGLKDSHG